MKKIKICTPVVGKTFNEFLLNLDKVQKISSFVELRVDQIEDLKEEDLLLIRKKTVKKAIFTCRTKKLFLVGLEIGFDYLDIDWEVVKKEKIIFPKTKKPKIIISYHNFNETPSQKKLKKLIANIKEFSPDIIKIATYVRNEKDNVTLFKILLDKKPIPLIIIGMGEKGKITRIFAPLLGSYLTYAKTPFGKSAPGQPDYFHLKEIYKIIFE